MRIYKENNYQHQDIFNTLKSTAISLRIGLISIERLTILFQRMLCVVLSRWPTKIVVNSKKCYRNYLCKFMKYVI